MAPSRGAGPQRALAGILHDLGKYSAAFQRRLDGPGEVVDHSTAGAKHVVRLAVGGADRGMAELIAYANRGPPRRASRSLDPVWPQELFPEPKDLMPDFVWEERDRSRLAFQLGFLGRIIFSCLVRARPVL